jgi:hypothetical protein
VCRTGVPNISKEAMSEGPESAPRSTIRASSGSGGTVAAAREAEAAGGKKGAAKGGKGAPADELKPVFARAWVSLQDLLQPGATETS